MSRFTPVYGLFVSRLSEIHLLKSKAAALARTKLATRHGPEINALCRASVVLLSSHIEAYIKELGEHTLDAIYQNSVCRSALALPFFYHVSKASIEEVRSVAGPENIAGRVRSFVNTESDMWQLTGSFPKPLPADQFNAGFANPKFDAIKAYMSRFGYADYRRDFYSTLKNRALATENGLNQIVDARNAIAHGEAGATKTPAEVAEMIATAKLFCRTSDIIFSDWCRNYVCSIR